MAGGYEWLIILVIVIIVFGIGRIGRLGGELGSAIREFRVGLRESQKEEGADEVADEEDAKK